MAHELTVQELESSLPNLIKNLKIKSLLVQLNAVVYLKHLIMIVFKDN